jgi:hypothetical protein
MLLGPSLTTADEDPFFRAVVRTAQKLGPGGTRREGRRRTHRRRARDPRCRPARDDSDDPGAVFFLPDEAPRQIAEVTAAALERASRSSARDHRGRAETARSRRESGPWIAGLDLLGR